MSFIRNTLFIAISTICIPFIAQASTLYSQPSAQSQPLGTIQQPQNYVKIYQQGPWVKVGNQANGQVGWVHIQQRPAQRPNQAMIQQALNQIQAQRAQIIAEQKQFQQQFDRAMTSLNQKQRALIQQAKVQKNQPPQAANQYHSTTVSYNGNGQSDDAIVKKTWLGKDGKRHTAQYKVPVKQLNKFLN